MRIAVFGLGYVGSVTAVCLTLKGHKVWGVDKHPLKVRWMAEGIAPLNEAEFANKLKAALDTGRLQAVTDVDTTVAKTDLALICVGTPTSESGEAYLGFVETVIREIDQALTANPHPYTIVIRSTVPAGTTEGFIRPILSKGAGQLLGKDLRICFNPEFLREGSAIYDFFNPPFTIVGLSDVDSEPDTTVAIINEVYKIETTPTIAMSCEEAELLKIVCNTFHALKISFANEVGSFAARLGADPERLMKAFVQDTKLNVSSTYLRPGFAFGGSCLPKDVRSLVHVGQKMGLKMPLCEAILPSNREHLQRALSAVLSHRGDVVGMAGLAFKPGTDDVRESPALWLARRIVEASRELIVYEPEINVDRLMGANLDFLQEQLPQFRECLKSWEVLSEQADIIVFTRPNVVPAMIETAINKPIINVYRLDSDLINQTQLSSDRSKEYKSLVETVK